MIQSEPEPTWNEEFKKVRRAAVAAAIAVHNAEVIDNAISGSERKGVRRHALKLRNALLYRLDATLYHLETIELVQVAGEKRLQEDLRRVRNQREILESVGRHQRFLFDDLVFNAVSFYDYLGRFCWSLLHGVADVKMRWDRAYKWAKHVSAGKSQENWIHGTKVGQAIIYADQRWVYRLIQFRSDVIHDRSEPLRGKVSTTIARQDEQGFTRTHELRPGVPAGFQKVKKGWDREVGDSIPEVSQGLMRELFSDAKVILDELVKELEGRVPEIPEGVVPKEPVLVRKPSGA